MISKLDNTPNTEIQVNHESLMHQRRWLTLSPELRQQYISPPDVEDAIRGAVHAQLETPCFPYSTPPLDTCAIVTHR